MDSSSSTITVKCMNTTLNGTPVTKTISAGVTGLINAITPEGRARFVSDGTPVDLTTVDINTLHLIEAWCLHHVGDERVTYKVSIEKVTSHMSHKRL